MPSRQGVVPTDCLMIQLPSLTRGMSLNALFRRSVASRPSPPARNLPQAAQGSCCQVGSAARARPGTLHAFAPARRVQRRSGWKAHKPPAVSSAKHLTRTRANARLAPRRCAAAQPHTLQHRGAGAWQPSCRASLAQARKTRAQPAPARQRAAPASKTPGVPEAWRCNCLKRPPTCGRAAPRQH